MEEVFKKWGEPALISAVVALLVALINRRLPFQQKLNEIQLHVMQEHFSALLESHRTYSDRLHKAIFAYENATKNPDLSDDVVPGLVIGIRQTFLNPDVMTPSQALMHSVVVPSSVRKAVADYVVNTQSLVSICLRKTQETGAQSAWDFALQHSEAQIVDVIDAIRKALCIDEMTRENQISSGTLWSTRVNRLRRLWRKIIHREEPANSFHSLMYYAQMSRIQDMASKLMATHSVAEAPEYEDLFAKNIQRNPIDDIDNEDELMDPGRMMRPQEDAIGDGERRISQHNLDFFMVPDDLQEYYPTPEAVEAALRRLIGLELEGRP